MKRVLVLVALIFALPAWSATYYVDCAASGDSGAGTSTATAWKTVGKVNGRSFSPGDFILFKRGCTWRETLYPPSAGTPDHPITFGAYDTGANPIISGAHKLALWTNESGRIWYAAESDEIWSQVWINNNLGDKKTAKNQLVNEYDWWWDSATSRLYLYATSDPGTLYTNPGIEAARASTAISIDNGRDYLIFESLTAEKAAYANIAGANPGDYVIVRNCLLRYGSRGMEVGNPNGAVFTGMEIHDNEVVYFQTTGISVVYRGTNCKIYRNKVHDIDYTFPEGPAGGGWTGPIKIFDDTGRIDNIEIYENDCYDSGPSLNNTGGVGIWSDFTQPATSVRIHHNWVHNCRGAGIFLEAVKNHHVWGNLVHNCGTNTVYGDDWTAAGIRVDTRETQRAVDNLIYNNTVYGGRAGIVVASYSPGVGMEISRNLFKNNIVVGQTEHRLIAVAGGANDPIYGTGNVYEYNCFGPESSNFIQWGYGTYKSTYAAWEAVYGGSTYSVQADPQLTNGAGGDLTLRATSPCIDAGADVGPSYGTALLPGSSWPTNVRTGDQYTAGRRWEIGAYLFPAGAPPPGSPTPTPVPTTGVLPTPTPTNPWPTPTPTATGVPPTPTPPPVTFGASFNFSPSFPAHGQPVQFTDNSVGASTWTWDFGDGTQSSLRNPAHTYAARGVYSVALWVSNGVSWTRAEKTVTVTGSGRVRRNLAGENVAPRRTPRD